MENLLTQNKKILIADDVEINRDMLTEILENDYQIEAVENGEEVIRILSERLDEFAVLLLDLLMPKLDGYGVLKMMNERGWMDKLPVLIISGEQSIQSEKDCFDKGVSDFIRKPLDATLVRRRVGNVAELSLYRRSLEQKVEEQTQRLKKVNENIVDILGSVVESRNLESGLHIQRVKGYTKILAFEMMDAYKEYGLTKEKIEVIVSASALHDVGKVAIPDNILLKPGRFTPEEYEIMKTHTTRGCELLDGIRGNWDEEYNKASWEICRYHHERFDGKGYPDHLRGEDIPIAAQLVSIADVYDALVSKRCYKEAYELESAYNMIINGECGIFSPKLIECFKKSRNKFEALALNKELMEIKE